MKRRRVTILRARGLRECMSFPEVLLWQKLRRDANGYRFRRQHPVGPYILDFYFPELKLAVEVDGYVHVGQAAFAHDTRRDTWLETQGIEVLRLAARLVLQDMECALQTIETVADERRSRMSA